MLLMIPGPIEVSPKVCDAYSVPPPSHLAPAVIEAFGASVEMARRVWCAGPDSEPFILAGSGTIAMEMAVVNLIEPGDKALVYNTGYFSDRMAEMVRRRGGTVKGINCEHPGQAPSLEKVAVALAKGGVKALFVTHVDTSTGVRADARGICALAREYGVLTIFDGVCATAAERFEMMAWGADVYLTASQKAIGLPAGLALMVASAAAMQTRARLSVPPPMSLDWEQWLPIMKAYESRDKSYFSTPATNLILALKEGFEEILSTSFGREEGISARFEQHKHAAEAMRGAWRAMGLSLLPAEGLEANTLSAILYPEGVGPELLALVKARGVVVAGGLYKGLQQTYFRVGHMGHAVTERDMLVKTIEAIEGALIEAGHPLKKGGALVRFDALFG
jgi:alanine-glyoxylate transaminase/serine-glyoxylate transaminase/serine-pyruvate transaminase